LATTGRTRVQGLYSRSRPPSPGTPPHARLLPSLAPRAVVPTPPRAPAPSPRRLTARAGNANAGRAEADPPHGWHARAGAPPWAPTVAHARHARMGPMPQGLFAFSGPFAFCPLTALAPLLVGHGRGKGGEAWCTRSGGAVGRTKQDALVPSDARVGAPAAGRAPGAPRMNRSIIRCPCLSRYKILLCRRLTLLPQTLQSVEQYGWTQSSECHTHVDTH
jgi:hypothetical protein